MSAHTPGPWSSFIAGRTISISIGNDANGRVPCVIGWTGFDSCGLPLKEQAANARLIAAAPDLLEALEGIIANDGGEGSCYDSTKLLLFRKLGKQAIAAATGKEGA